MQGIAAMTATVGIPAVEYRAQWMDGRGPPSSPPSRPAESAQGWARRDPLDSPAPETTQAATKKVGRDGQGADSGAPESADPANHGSESDPGEADTERQDAPARPRDARMMLAAMLTAEAAPGAATPTAVAVASVVANTADGLRMAHGAGRGDPAPKAVPQAVVSEAVGGPQAVGSEATAQPPAAAVAARVLGRTSAGPGTADAKAGPAAPVGEAMAASQAGGDRGTASSASLAAAVTAPKASGQDAASSRLTTADGGAAAVVALQGTAVPAAMTLVPGPRGTKTATDGSESRETAPGKGESAKPVLDPGGRTPLAARIEEGVDRAGPSVVTGTDALKGATVEASHGGAEAAPAAATAVGASPAGSAPAAEPQAPVGGPAAQTAQTPGGGPSASLTEQLAAPVRWMAVRDGEHVTVRLQPPELGKVRITFRSEGQEVRGILEVENASTLARLGREMPALAQRLQDVGVQVRRLEVALDGSHDGQASPFGPYDDRGGGFFGAGGPDVPFAGDLAADGEPVGAGLAGPGEWVADAAINVQA